MGAKGFARAYETSPVGANFLLTSGSGSITRRVRSGAPSCEDSLMRHPPHPVLLVSDALSSAVLPVFSARGVTAACTVGYAVTSQWDSHFQGFEPINGCDADEQSRTDDVQAQRDGVHRGCEPRGSAHEHRRGLGGPHSDARHEVPARTVEVLRSVHAHSGRLLGRAHQLPEADAGHAPRCVQLGVGGRHLRPPPGGRVKRRHEPGSSGEHLVAPLRRPGRDVVRRP